MVKDSKYLSKDNLALKQNALENRRVTPGRQSRFKYAALRGLHGDPNNRDIVYEDNPKNKSRVESQPVYSRDYRVEYQPVYPKESVQPVYQGYSNISTTSDFIPIGIDQSVDSNRSRVTMSSGESGVIVDGKFVNNPKDKERQYNDDYVSRSSAIPTDTSSCVSGRSESYYR
jgi:hypothetical protein